MATTTANRTLKAQLKSTLYLSRRDLGGNQIEKLAPGVFNNNTELVYL